MKVSFRKNARYIVFISIIVCFLRLPFARIPFYNIDETIYAVAADSILHGGILYKNAVDPCAPITPYVYAGIFKLFGCNNMFAVHCALIFLIVCIATVLLLISSLTNDRKTGYVAALFFTVFSFTYHPQDVLAFNTEWLAAFFGSLGAYFFLKHVFLKKDYLLFLSGIFFGLGVFSKQLILFYFFCAVVFCGCSMFGKSARFFIKKIVLLSTGFITVAVCVLFYFYWNNALYDFWFWFWEYHSKFYVSQISVMGRIEAAYHYLLDPKSFVQKNYFLFACFLIGSFATVFRYFYSSRKPDKRLLFDLYLVIWGIFAYVGVSYSGRSFGHYFILILPPFCILASSIAVTLFDRLGGFFGGKEEKNTMSRLFKSISSASFVLVIISGVLSVFFQYFKYNESAGLWKTIGAKERFVPKSPPLRELTAFIEKNSDSSDRIFVWGFYPGIYVLSNRAAASRYLNCNFLTGLIPWTNIGSRTDTKNSIVPGSRKICIDEIKLNAPLYIIDTSPGNINFYGKYPLGTFKELSDIVKAHYNIEKDFLNRDGSTVFRLYKRKRLIVE